MIYNFLASTTLYSTYLLKENSNKKQTTSTDMIPNSPHWHLKSGRRNITMLQCYTFPCLCAGDRMVYCVDNKKLTHQPVKAYRSGIDASS